MRTIPEIASRWLRRKPEQLTEAENRVLQRAIDHLTVSEDQAAKYEKHASLGDRVADHMAQFGGSWTFILGFLVFLAFWAVLNAWLLGREAFDPYPFIFLNLMLSMLAALQAPVIMMSQNRQAERDRLAARHDYEVNLKAEIEIMALHEKMDILRQKEILALRDEIAGLREAIGAMAARPAKR